MRDAPIKTSAYQQGINAVSIKIKERLGTLRILEDGRKFRYAKAGALLAAGQATAMGAVDSEHIDCLVAASNSSGTQIEVTVSAGVVLAADALAGGYLQVNDGLLEGRTCRIDSSTALAVDGTSITLSLVDRMVDYDGTTEVTLVANPWSNVVVGTAGAAPAGVAPVPVASGSYFWSQVSGPALAKIAGTPAIGVALILGAAGAVGIQVGAGVTMEVGYSYGTAGVAGEFKPVMITLE